MRISNNASTMQVLWPLVLIFHIAHVASETIKAADDDPPRPTQHSSSSPPHITPPTTSQRLLRRGTGHSKPITRSPSKHSSRSSTLNQAAWGRPSPEFERWLHDPLEHSRVLPYLQMEIRMAAVYRQLLEEDAHRHLVRGAHAILHTLPQRFRETHQLPLLLRNAPQMPEETLLQAVHRRVRGGELDVWELAGEAPRHAPPSSPRRPVRPQEDRDIGPSGDHRWLHTTPSLDARLQELSEVRPRGRHSPGGGAREQVDRMFRKSEEDEVSRRRRPGDKGG